MLYYICKKERDKRKEKKMAYVEMFDYVLSVEQYERERAQYHEEWLAMDDWDRSWYDDEEEFIEDRFHSACYPDD